MKIKVYNKDGSSSTEKEFSNVPALEEGKGVQALRDVIVIIQNNLRQGNASTKTRAEVSGTGKKPWRQKGTGMARHGSKRSPIWVGGGVAFGPRPRDYSKKVNARVRKLALQRAIVDSVSGGSLSLIESITVAEPKTKLFNELVAKISDKGSILVVDESFESNAALAARNIERVNVIEAESVNAWDLVRFNHVLMSEGAFNKVLERAAEKEKTNVAA